MANYNKAVVDAVNDVARAASQVETLAQKNQHQQQIEHDAQRVVGLAQARFNAGIIAGSGVSEAKIPALREQCNGLLLQGQWLDASIPVDQCAGRRLSRVLINRPDGVPLSGHLHCALRVLRRFIHQRTPATIPITSTSQMPCLICWSRLCSHGAITSPPM